MSREQWIIDQLRRPVDSSVILGIGDDAAAVSTSNRTLICHDTLNEGTHFLATDPVDSVGHRSLAVNISDIAAMGGRPHWASLSLSLPDVDEQWVVAFTKGFHAIADRFDVALVGGDTTRGPLSISVCLLGQPNDAGMLTRGCASIGDLICVSGALGGAAYALDSPGAATQKRLWYPEPRVELGRLLVGIATSALDLSDGLIADLPRLLGKCGATIDVDKVPVDEIGSVERTSALQYAINGGDDYELCFTIPRDRKGELTAIADRAAVDISVIGTVTGESGIRYVNTDGTEFAIRRGAYEHFPE